MTDTIQEYRRDNFLVSTNPSRLQLDVIYGFLSQSYWASDRSREVIAHSIEYSLCFGVYDGDTQIGLARVVTDYISVGHLVDVFIVESYQGRGLGKWLMNCVVSHPALQDLMFWMLTTRDAHGLYEKYGFEPLGDRAKAVMVAKQPHVCT